MSIAVDGAGAVACWATCSTSLIDFSYLPQKEGAVAKVKIRDLSDVSETLLIPLYYRAQESVRTDALIRDPKAVELLLQIEYDFSRFKKLANEQAVALVRTRVFDTVVRTFLAHRPNGVVVNIGCGLDTRSFRLDNGQAEWYELDLPPVIALRAQLLGEPCCTHALAYSALDFEWMDAVPAGGRACLFTSEGVLPYLEEREVRLLVLTLKERFSGAELVFDALSPFFIWIHNVELAATRVSARLHWGVQDGKTLESWSPGIRLLERWLYFDQPEARERGLGWMRVLPGLNTSASILHYQLGER